MPATARLPWRWRRRSRSGPCSAGDPAPASGFDAFANYPKAAITFPAAILQPPFFDPAVDPTVNYGGIAASIAHEMTHQFDDQRAKYDEQGRLASWWSAADRAAFAKHTAVLAAQFDTYEPLPALHVNGALTLGENIADLGGLTIAYDAYRTSLGARSVSVPPTRYIWRPVSGRRSGSDSDRPDISPLFFGRAAPCAMP